VRLLKALFLVKYVKEFKATPAQPQRADAGPLRSGHCRPCARRLEAALNLLEQQTYIQRNGDVYEYLTDEEKDIEQEIKNTEVESADVRRT
jgi:hypothetical protein